MTTFDDRERGFEGKFAHDQDLEFKALARRNRLLGLWAGGLMDLEDPALENYATAVVKYEVAHPGEDAIRRKIAQDLSGAGLKVTEDQVRGKMDELLAVARGEVQASEG
jgi:hypothetical protein